MGMEDAIDYKNDTYSCVVCGKNVASGGGFARIEYEGTIVNLCCLDCLGVFVDDPAHHIARFFAKIASYMSVQGRSRGGIGGNSRLQNEWKHRCSIGKPSPLRAR